MSPIEYGVANDEGVLTTNSGEIVNSTSVSNYSRGKDPTTWEEPLLDITEVYENYTLVSNTSGIYITAYDKFACSRALATLS